MSERSNTLLLLDIQEAAQSILAFTSQLTLEKYKADKTIKFATERGFIIIGEAASKIDDPFKQSHVHINWRQVKDFRNVIVHDYFGVDDSIVWTIIQSKLPQLLADITILINKITP